MALAGLSACRRPVEKILPFVNKPEDMIPGVPVNYATSMPFRGNLRPLLVESTDGRPTKVEGNPDHPHMQGSSTVFEQASLLSLYDPDRSQVVLRDGAPGTWDAFVTAMNSLPTNSRLGIIAPQSSSMTMAGLKGQLAGRFQEVQWVEYSATLNNSSRAAASRVFGSPVADVWKLFLKLLDICRISNLVKPFKHYGHVLHSFTHIIGTESFIHKFLACY